MIALRGIRKVYGAGSAAVTALHEVTLNVAAGEFLAIMGPSGSGKSTLMNLLGLLDRPSDGVYQLDGRDVQDLSDDDLARVRREKLGFIFQSFNLLPRATALKNVSMPLMYAGVGRSERRQLALTMLEQVGLTNRADHRPSELSGGQQQRVAIARALVNNPVVLLADEPTGNLDSTTGAEVLELLRDLNRHGVTILMITHDEHVAAAAERIIRLFDGRIVEDERLRAIA